MIVNLAAGIQAFSSNVFLVTGDRTVLVDPGANFDVAERVREHVDALDAIVLTHTHPDHVGNLGAAREAFGAEVLGFDPDEADLDRVVDDGDTVRLGDHDYTAIHTPGHKNDHLCFYAVEPGVLFAGDLVFQNGGFGRTDFEEGDRELLIRSIDRLLDLVDESLAELHAGHGPSVTDEPYRHLVLARRMAEQF